MTVFLGPPERLNFEGGVSDDERELTNTQLLENSREQNHGSDH
jgi:hypothetical protein